MYLAVCGGLLATAVVLNMQDRRMLALTLAVGASVFLPVPSHTQLQFYGTCITVELVIAAFAVFYQSRATGLIFYCCIALIASHLMGWVTDGSTPFSPYRVIVKLLECAQLLACVASSPVLTPILRNSDATPT